MSLTVRVLFVVTLLLSIVIPFGYFLIGQRTKKRYKRAIGTGSIRIHDSQLQDKMFKLLGFTEERAQEQFGFLMNAFKYGAPPHGGLAYGLDRFVSLFAGLDSIRDCIAFPKNNSGRDVMLDAPGVLDPAQLDELNLIVDIKK